MNNCLCVLSYGQVPRLMQSINSVDLPTIVFNPLRSWWFEDMPDHTLNRLAKRPLTIVRKDWKNETEVRNDMITIAHQLGYDMMIMLDADEVLEGYENITTPGAYSAELIDYGPNEELLPQRTHRPIVAVDVREGKHIFTDKRVASVGVQQADLKVHHYSYDVPEEYEYKIKKQDGDRWPPLEHRSVIE